MDAPGSSQLTHDQSREFMERTGRLFPQDYPDDVVRIVRVGDGTGGDDPRWIRRAKQRAARRTKQR